MVIGTYKVTFAARLKEARKRKGWTQADIEDELGISKSSLSQYENGKLEPSIDIIGTLASFYDVPTDWLFGLGRQSNTSNYANDRETSKQIEKEAKRIRRAEKQMGIFGGTNKGTQYISENATFNG